MGNTSESSEDYLEAILLLGKRLPVVRAVDIAAELNYTKPSVSVALRNLRERELITVTDHGYINLTESGRAIADAVFEKHEWFTKWLVSLGIDEDTASRDACRMEHDISKESFEAIKRALPKVHED